MKTFDDIQTIFFREKKPYWSLINAKGKRESSTPDAVMALTEDKERLEASWAYLSDEVLPTCDTGRLMLNLLTNATASKTKQSYDFQWGDAPTAPPSVGAINAVNARQNQGSIGGLGSIAGLEFISGLMQNGRGDADRYRDQLMEERLDKMEMKFKIQGLEKELASAAAAPAADDSMGALIKGVLKENFMEILDRFAPLPPTTAIATLRSPKTAPLSTRSNGVLSDSKNQAEATLEFDTDDEADEDTEDTEETTDNGADAATQTAPPTIMSKEEAGLRLQNIFRATMKLFPNHHPIEVLEEIVAMAQKPSFAFVVPLIDAALTKRKKT